MPSPVDQIIGAESGGNPYATNPRSSATGAGQFIESTWLDLLSRTRPDLVEGKSRDEILALRNDPTLSREMVGALADENGQKLGAAGLPVNPGTQYLAHFAGPAGAIKVLQSDPGAPVGDLLGAKVVAANPFLARMTAGDLAAWAGRKMGSPAAPVTSPTMPQAPMPLSAAAMPANAPSGLPLFAPPATAPQQPQQQQEPPASILDSIAAPGGSEMGRLLPQFKRKPFQLAQKQFFTRG